MYGDTTQCHDVQLYVTVKGLQSNDPCAISINDSIYYEDELINNGVEGRIFYLHILYIPISNTNMVVNINAGTPSPYQFTSPPFNCRAPIGSLKVPLDYTLHNGVAIINAQIDGLSCLGSPLPYTCSLGADIDANCRASVNMRYPSGGGACTTIYSIALYPAPDNVTYSDSEFPKPLHLELVNPGLKLTTSLDLTLTDIPTYTNPTFSPANNYEFINNYADYQNVYSMTTLQTNNANGIFFGAAITQNDNTANGESFVVYSNATSTVLLNINSFDATAKMSHWLVGNKFKKVSEGTAFTYTVKRLSLLNDGLSSPYTGIGNCATVKVQSQSLFVSYILPNGVKMDCMFPYGYVSGKASIYYHSVDIPYASKQPNFQLKLYNPSATFSVITNIPETPDTLNIPILNFEMISLPNGQSHVLRVTCVYELGCYEIVVQYDQQSHTVKLHESDLVSGIMTNGVFEKLVNLISVNDVSIMVYVYDISCRFLKFGINSSTFKTGDLIGLNPNGSLRLLPPFIGSFPLSKVDITFSKSVLDVTKGDARTIMYVNRTSSQDDPLLQPVLEIDFVPYNNNKHRIFGSYDSSISCYVFPITVPKGSIGGPLRWNLLTSPPINYTTMLNKVQIISIGGDIRPPLISAISQPTPTRVGDNIIASWSIRIIATTGLIDSTFGIRSGLDPQYYYTTVNDVDRTSGDQFAGTYKVTFSIQAPDNNCASQTYYIDYVKLVAQNGAISATNMTIDPLLSFTGSSNIILAIQCTNAPATTVPILTAFRVSTTTVDVGSLSRLVTITLTTTDTGSGISPRHNPIVYMAAVWNDVIQFPTKLVSSNSTHSDYAVDCVIPYGYGSSDSNKILLSLYGIMDNHYNLKGYTSNDLIALSFQGTIDRIASSKVPILESHSGVSTNGGMVTVYGRMLGSTTAPTLKYTISGSTNETDVVPSLFTTILFIFTAPPLSQGEYLTLTATSLSITSNSLTIHPYIPPTPTPSPTPSSTTNNTCSSPCSTNGVFNIDPNFSYLVEGDESDVDTCSSDKKMSKT
eukprot:gene21008-25226_t